MKEKNIDVLAIARLARIELDESEVVRLGNEMRMFDEFAARLGATLPKEHSDGKYLPLSECAREDDVLLPDASASELISLSSGAKDKYIAVPITVGKEGEI